jgi:hypothetical protein
MPVVILTLVFVDELLAAVAAGIWGAHTGGVWRAILAPIAVVIVWWAFASPKARWGGPVVRPVTKVVVFGAACVGLWVAGHHTLSIAMLVFSVAINALAQLPQVTRASQTLGSH